MLLCLAGCNLHADLDSVEYVGAEANPDLGVGDGPDAQNDTDSDDAKGERADAVNEGDAVDQDGAGGDVDAGPAAPTNECDLLAEPSECQEGKGCVFDRSEDRTRCVASSELNGTAQGAEGQSCASYEDCNAGLVCIDWASPDPRGSVCSKPCSRMGASRDGDCAGAEFCASTELPLGEDVGFCTTACDILNPSEACAEFERCVPDPFEPNVDFAANARCLRNYDGGVDGNGNPVKSMSSSCSGAELDEDGCPAGLTCLAVVVSGTRDEYCLEPCNPDENGQSCSYFQSLDTCTPIPEATGVGYCTQGS